MTTITMFRNRGPLVSDGYQIVRCYNGNEALDHVNRAFWPSKWIDDIASGRSPLLGSDPTVTLNNEFNKNGYWFLDYWDENWPKFTNEAIGNVLTEHFEGETCEAPKSSIRHSSLGGLSQLESEKRDIMPLKPSGPRPSQIVITSMFDETKTRYFDSVNAVGAFVRKLAHRNGGEAGQDAINKLTHLNDQLALYGWVYNGETNAMHWIATTMNYLMRKADLDDFETRLLEGLHAFLFEDDTNATVLRDLIIEGPLAQDD